MIYFKNSDGHVFAYESMEHREIYGGHDLTPMTASEIKKHINPKISDQEMLYSEIAQDKKYLADTDWIIAKIGEASLSGQDTASLTEQYAKYFEERELARVRIRAAEGKA